MTYWANSVTGSGHSACTYPMLNILVLQASGVLIKNGTTDLVDLGFGLGIRIFNNHLSSS